MVAGENFSESTVSEFWRVSVGEFKLLTLTPSANKWIWNLVE